jgi:hypothetical protein
MYAEFKNENLHLLFFQGGDFLTLTINISRFTNVHEYILSTVNEWLIRMKSEILSYAALELEETLKISSICELKLSLALMRTVMFPVLCQTDLKNPGHDSTQI